MRIFFSVLILACLAVAAGCADYASSQQGAAPEQANESMLAAAGFHMIPADTPQKQQVLASLPARQLRFYRNANGLVFWYADPQGCKCIYQGDQKAYERYQDLLVQQRDVEAYEQEAEMHEGLVLNAFNPLLFPVPILVPVGATTHGGTPGHPGGTSHGGAGTPGAHGGPHEPPPPRLPPPVPIHVPAPVFRR